VIIHRGKSLTSAMLVLSSDAIQPCTACSLTSNLISSHVPAGKKVLELGCGAGLLGVVLHRTGAAGVSLTDGDSQTLCNCRHNLHINGAEVQRYALPHTHVSVLL